MQLMASEEYGLRCLIQVARATDAEPVSVARIAEAEGLGPEYTAKLLRRLRIAGLVESVRGVDGGYRLARPGTEISVWSALLALGSEFFDEDFCTCHQGQRRRCTHSGDCPLRPLWRSLQGLLRGVLEGISLDDLQRDESTMSAWLDAAVLPTGSPGARPDRVVLFMKGDRHTPQCGFSARVVQILDGLLPDYTTCDVLEEPEIRHGIKEYTRWPTVPQLYVRGEFVGGCDIISELHESGELQQVLEAASS
jgi:Grx4 family monothiol glutaredoxin